MRVLSQSLGPRQRGLTYSGGNGDYLGPFYANMHLAGFFFFFRAEKGCTVEGKKFRRARNFRKPWIP